MITFDVGFRVDTKTLKSSLDTVRNDVQRAFSVDESSIGINKSLSQAIVQAKNFENILTKASSSRGLSFISLNSELRKAGTTATQMVSDLNAGGAAFKNTTNEALVAFSNANRQAITLNDHIKEMGRVFMQSLKFTVAQQAIHTLQMSLQESFEWMVDLDAQLTQIQIVSGKTAQQMASVSEQIVERSRALKVAAQDYAEAAQIYYQQGLQDAEVQRRADITIKAAQAANESTKAMSDMLTAVWNTYQMQGDELENAASVAAKLGAETAIEFRDIAEAMQISATAASQMGVSYNSLASIIATVGSTTRQSASIIGNAYKTIFNNFQRLKVDGENGEVTLKAASQQLQALGINLLDASGQVKELDEVIMQAGENWKNYSQNEQLAIAQIVGGTRQFGQFLALMNNFDTYLANLNSANSEIGAETLEAQYETALESIENKAVNTAEAWKRAFSNFYDENGIKTIIDLFGDLGNAVDDTLEAFGGLEGLFRLLLALGTTKMPGMIKNLSGLAINFKDSLTPGARQNRINQDFNRLFLAGQNYKNNQIQDVFARSGGVLTKTLSDEIVAIENSNKQWESKLQISKEVASTQSTLNQIISQGSGASQIQAQMLQEEIKTRQQNVFAMKDEIDGLTSLARMKTDNIQRVYNNLSGNLPQGMNNPSLHASKQQTLENGARIVNTGEFLGMGEQVAQLKSLLAEFSKLADGEQAPAGLGKAFEASLEAVRQKLVEVNSLIQNTPKLLNQTQEVFANLDNVSVKTLQNLISTLEQSGAAIDDLQNEFKQLGANGETNIKLTETQVQSLVRALFSLSDNFMLSGQNSGQFGVNMTELGNILQEIATKSGISAEQITKLQQALERARLTTNQFKQDNIALMGSFAQMASGIQMLTLSFTTLSNGIKNGNLNFLTLVTSFSMLLSSMQSIAAIGKNVNAMKSLASVLTNIGGKLPLIGAGAKAMGGSIAAGAATGGVALSTLLPIIGLVAAGLFALTKIIDLVGKAFAEAEAKAYNASPEGRIDAATQAMGRLNTSIGENQTQLDSLKSAYDGLSEARAAIDNCTQGTTEWTQAILDNNTAVLGLLDTHSQFFDMSDITIDENGIMSINEDAYKNAIEEYQNLIYGQQAQVIKESQKKTLAEIDKQNEDFKDELSSMGFYTVNQNIVKAMKDNFQEYWGDDPFVERDVSDANFRKQIYSSFDDPSFTEEDFLKFADTWLTSEYTGVGIEDLIKSIDSSEAIYSNEYMDLINETDFMDQLVELLNNADKELQSRDEIINIISNALEATDKSALGGGVDLTIEQLADRLAPIIEANSGEIAALNSELAVYTAQVNNSGKQLASIFTGNSNVLMGMSADEKAIYAGASAGVAQDYIDEALDTVIEAAQKDGTYSTKIRQYMESQFGENQKYSIEDDGIYLLDENGKMAEEAAVQFGEIFAQETMETAQESFDNYFSKLRNDLNSLGSEQGRTAAENALKGSGSITYKDLEEWGRGSLDSLERINPEAYAIIEQNMKQAQDFWGKINKDTQKLAEQYDYSLDSAQKIQSINEVLESQLGKANYLQPENDELAQIFGNTDWTNFNAVNDTVNQLRSMGYEIDTTSEGWQNFINIMREGFKAIPDLNGLIDQLEQVKDITSNLEIGDIISSDDYQTLINYNSALADYFAILSDGSARMIGDPLDLQQEIKRSEQEGLKESAQAYLDRSKELGAIQDTNYYQNDEGELLYNNNNISTQLDYIQAYSPDAFSIEQIDQWRDKLSNSSTIATEDLDKIREAFDNLGISSESMGAMAQQALNELAFTADSAEERISMLQSGDINQQAYNIAATEAINQERFEGLDINEVQSYSDSLQEAAKNSKILSEDLIENEEAAEEVARVSMKMTDGVEELAEGFEEWGDILKKSSKESEEYAVALNETKEAMSKLLDIDEEFLSNDFITDNLDDIEKAADGNEEAIDRLREAALDDVVINITAQNDLSDGWLAAEVDNLQSILNGMYPEGITIGTTLDTENMDTSGFVNALNNLIVSAGMTQEQVNALLSGMGFTANFAEEPQQMTYTTPPITTTRFRVTPAEPYDPGNGQDPIPQYDMRTEVVKVEPGKTIPYEVDAASLETTPPGVTTIPKIESLTYTGKGSMNNYSGANSGGSPAGGGKGSGGGKKSSYKKPTPKVRYTNRENQISRTEQISEKLAQVEDQLYGRAKLAAMQKKSDLIVQQVKDYKALYDEAVAYREQDMQDLAATQLGQAVPMQIDAEGNILNQEEMDDYMREWKDRIDAIEDEGAKEAEQRAYDISEQAYTYYKEAQEKALEAMKNAVDQLGEWISNEIEKRQYQMEIDIKVSDRQLSLLEFTLEELGSAGWITNWEDGLDNIIDQVDSIMNAGESTIDSTYQLIDLFDKVNNGGLDWSQLDQDMKDMFPQEVWEQANANGTLTNDILEAIGDNTETLLDYAGQLTEAWVSAWEKIGEAMDSYLEQMERARSPLETQAEVLETFISVADQVGWDVDKIDKYNELLDKQTDILEANYEASVKQAEATKDALDAMEPVYQDYLERFENGEITGQQFDVIQEQYYNLVDANQEAISQMTSDWSAYVENLQEKFEIAQQQIIKTWNDGIGNMWNDLAESQEGFDLFESLRTWYLDDFNKDYGLTTLTNQIEDAMNSISDPSRLKEYDAFMAEIVAKQEEGYELSQGELDVLNARFQLMQAQDAYEEAKNNKNTMRLTRDASGNYSYVYSSDSTENQEQAVLDAQKALHDAEEQYLSESESRWYEWMLKKYDLVTNTDWELYAHDEEYRRQFQLQWDQLTQAMQNATNDVNNALTYTDRTYEETAIHHMTNTESMNQANAQYNEQFQILWDEIQAKYKETDQKVQESASLIIDSNLSLEDAANDLMGTIDDTMGNMMDTTDELADNMSSNMQTMIEDTASWSDSIIEDINAIIAKYKELYEAQTNVMQNHTGETKNYEWHMDGNTGQWYYGDNNGGYYKSGWMEIDGKWYFFDDAGYLDMGTDRGDGTFWVDNGHYQVDKDGAWVEGTIAEGHTPGDWAYGSDTKNWGANYGDLAGGNWSNTNSGGQLSSRPSSGSSSNSSSGSSSSNQDYSQYLPFDDILEESDSNFNYDEDGIRVVNPSFNGSHAGGVDNAHWIGNDAEGWFFGTKDKSGRGNQGSYMDGWLKINGKYYHFDEDGWLDTDFNGQDWHDDFPDEENKSAVWRRYAKGGYTGNRGLKGVDSIPAILAPGEYVLNHDDTTKILSAVQLLRGLSSGALAAAANAISKLANGSIPQTTQSEQIPVQQDVHIEATFPNVSVASEIEDALNNLVNETVQLIGSQNSRRL